MPRLLNYRRFLHRSLLGFCLLVIIHAYYQSGNNKDNTAGQGTQKSLEASVSHTSELVRPGDQTIVLQPSFISSCTNLGFGIYTLILVMSTLENKEGRDAIRSSLGASIERFKILMEPNEQIKLLFFLGLPRTNAIMETITGELSMHQDIVVDDVKESPSQLDQTVKTLRMFKWVVAHCSQARYLVKMNDNVYLNLPIFLDFLQASVPADYDSGQLIAGYKYSYEAIGDRTKDSEVLASISHNEKTNSPEFAAGFFQLFQLEAVIKIYNTSLQTPLYPMDEDAFVTGFIAAAILNMTIFHVPEIHPLWSKYEHYFSTSCTVQKCMVINEVKPKYMRCWDTISLPDFVCSFKPLFLSC